MIRVNVEGVVETQRALKQIRDAVLGRIMLRSLQRAGKAMEARADKDVRSELNLKRDNPYLRRAISIHKPSKSRPIVELRISHRPIRLFHFGAKQGPRGVTVKVKTKGARARVQRGFFLRTKSGKTLLMRRLGDERLPIEKLFGPEPYQVIKPPHRQAAIAGIGERTFRQRFAHEYAREVEKIASRRTPGLG